MRRGTNAAPGRAGTRPARPLGEERQGQDTGNGRGREERRIEVEGERSVGRWREEAEVGGNYSWQVMMRIVTVADEFVQIEFGDGAGD